jgi:glycosyltransferase involved in cell wall biosynthesis
MFYTMLPYTLISTDYRFSKGKGEFGPLRSLVVTVIIPAYNEEETIGNVITETTSVMDSVGMPYEIIVVNDGSTDKTGLIASEHKVTVLSNQENRGKGFSLRRALRYAHGDIIVTLDSDGEHSPKEIPDLVNPLFNGTDIVSGSRFMGCNTHVTTKLNRIGNFMFNLTILALTGKSVTDSQTGFRAVKHDVLENLNLESEGYEIETEITVKGLRNGFVFEEKPITCERRQDRVSKLKLLKDGTNILRTILRATFMKME